MNGFRKTNILQGLFLLLGLLGISAFAQTQTSFLVLNEIQVNNPGGDSQECEYMEVRGDAGTFIPSNTYLVEVEGDGGGAGTADFVYDLGTEVIGSNGILVVSWGVAPALTDKNAPNIGAIPCGTRNYTSGGATFVGDTGVSLENGTISFLLINSPTTAITQGTDYDTDDNGTLEALPMDATIIDAVGWTDGTAGDWVYGGVDVTPGNAVPPYAATRNFSSVTPLTGIAWFADDIVGSVDSVLYDQTNLTGGYMIDFITPGAQNLAPTAAAGLVRGRVTTSTGRGLKFVTLMITGGRLDEPLFATTNHFGRYQFEDIPVGETYVLQVFSKRYTFEQSSVVINLKDNISGADFIGVEGAEDR